MILTSIASNFSAGLTIFLSIITTSILPLYLIYFVASLHQHSSSRNIRISQETSINTDIGNNDQLSPLLEAKAATNTSGHDNTTKKESFSPKNHPQNISNIHPDKSSAKNESLDSQSQRQTFSFNVSGIAYYQLKKAISYAKRNDLLYDTFDGLTASDIRDDFYDYADPVFETDLSEAIQKIELIPDANNPFDPLAIKVILTINGIDFMIGYVSSDKLDIVWQTLDCVKNQEQEMSLSGYASGGKCKYVSSYDDHIVTSNKRLNFIVYVTTTDIPPYKSKKYVEHPSMEQLLTNQPIKIHKKRKMLSSFVTVDIETTGLNAPFDKIIQIAAVKYKNNKPVDTYSSFVKPGDGISLSRYVERKTGITNKQLANAPTFNEVKKSFINFVEDLPWIGHNIIKFDIPFLYLSGLGINDFFVEDTWNLAKKNLNREVLGNLKLPTLKKYYKINLQSHNALTDCQTTALVYMHLRDDHLNNFLEEEKEKLSSFKNFNFVIIGEFPEIYKTYLVNQIVFRSGNIDNRVLKRTDYLLHGITKKKYKAVEKAKEYGTKIITYSQFVELANTLDNKE